MLNPYDPPRAEGVAPRTDAASNPVKPLLYVIGGFCVFQSTMMIPSALFVGLRFLSVGIVMLAFGVTAISLGRQRFSRFVRFATIVWGALATLLVLLAIAIEPPSTRDVVGLIFTAWILLVVGAVPLIAFQKTPVDFGA